jgi:hypothetical protein
MSAPQLALNVPQPEIAQPEIETSRDTLGAVAHLAALHREGEETARLANLLGRSLHVAIALPVLVAAGLIYSRAGIGESATWAGLVLAASAAIFLSYRRTIGQPFERTALKSFSQDLHAILVFAGFAWGAGAFLVLPASAGLAAIVLFTAGASMVMALLLREGESAFLFLAPAAVVASFACVLRPLEAGALGAAFVLIASAAIAAVVTFAQRWSAREALPDLAGLPSA